MFYKIFNFRNGSRKEETFVNPSNLYKEDLGYGFFTEEARKDNENLNLPELNSGFDVWYWLQGKSITNIQIDEEGCYIDDEVGNIPLSFKLDVPHTGNYLVTIELFNELEGSNLILFTGRRRFVFKKNELEKGERITYTCNVNVCDIIPRGKETRYRDLTLDISIIGKKIHISRLEIKENPSSTIFIAGDSTVTDQPASYPYDPGVSYSGWGQGLTLFVTPEIAISNHAHSGLTTESFRSEGHYDIILDSIKPGDYCMFQFAHNDQKLSHLKHNEGYRNNLITYINEIRARGAYPILVTPICRNTWRGTDGTYHDLLVDYATTCIELGREMDVPVVDLHRRSYEFITSLGLEAAKRYFYPGDYTHSNDYGAYLMAHFVALELSAHYNFITLNNYSNWIAPNEIKVPTPPKGSNYVIPGSNEVKVNFTDIMNSQYKKEIQALTSQAILPNDNLYRPIDFVTRVEALSFVVKLYGFFATNVYNDMFTDIVGHEWYAGIVECACSNGIFDMKLVKDRLFEPNRTITYNELYSYCVNGYKSRKQFLDRNIGEDLNLEADHIITREECAALLYRFKEVY